MFLRQALRSRDFTRGGSLCAKNVAAPRGKPNASEDNERSTVAEDRQKHPAEACAPPLMCLPRGQNLAQERTCTISDNAWKWCPGKDSNLHALQHRYLKPACLPIPPPGRGAVSKDRPHACQIPRKFPPAGGTMAPVQPMTDGVSQNPQMPARLTFIEAGIRP